MIKAIKKSTNFDNTGVRGIIIRGKYTLVSRFELDIRLCVLAVIEAAKYDQGKTAAYENIGYGIPSLGTLASFPKITVKTTIENTGLINAHANPSMVCL